MPQSHARTIAASGEPRLNGDMIVRIARNRIIRPGGFAHP